VRTSCGAFEIALDTKRAPQTVNSFAYLAREGFYDGLDFYKTISGFAIYGGDPALDGSGGPGYSVVEPPPASARYGRGVVAIQTPPPRPFARLFFFFASLSSTVEATTPVPPSFAISALPRASSRLAGADSFTSRVAAAPESRLNEAPPMIGLLAFLPRLTLALSWKLPLQGPPEQVSPIAARPPATLATPAALAVPGAIPARPPALAVRPPAPASPPSPPLG
jgi:cyclophilin family peptidyl-prolyl cis-trans isomerase